MSPDARPRGLNDNENNDKYQITIKPQSNKYKEVLLMSPPARPQRLAHDLNDNKNYINNKSKHLKGQLWPRVSHVFPLFYSCNAPPPPPSQSSVVTPRKSRFSVIPATPHPFPHLRGQLLPRVSHVFPLFMVFHGFWLVSMVFGWFQWFFKVVSWLFMVFGWVHGFSR